MYNKMWVRIMKKGINVLILFIFSFILFIDGVKADSLVNHSQIGGTVDVDYTFSLGGKIGGFEVVSGEAEAGLDKEKYLSKSEHKGFLKGKNGEISSSVPAVFSPNGSNGVNAQVLLDKKATYSVKYCNVGTYKGNTIDVRATVIDYELSPYYSDNWIDGNTGNTIKKSLIRLRENVIGISVENISSVTVLFEFYKSNSPYSSKCGKMEEPIEVYGNTSYWDVDAKQGVYFEDGTKYKTYLAPNVDTRLEYSKTGNSEFIYTNDPFNCEEDSLKDEGCEGKYAFSEAFKGNQIKRKFHFSVGGAVGLSADSVVDKMNYDYSLDVACTNCKSNLASSKAYVFQDTNDWNAIFNSREVSNYDSNIKACQTLKNYFTNDGNTYCREEYHVFFPNQTNKISIQSGRFFTLNAPFSEFLKLPIDIPNFRPVEVKKIIECKNKNGTAINKSLTNFDKDTGKISIDYDENLKKETYDFKNLYLISNDNPIINESGSGNYKRYEITNNYTLPSEFYRYVDKATGKVIKDGTVLSDEVKKNYKDLGISGLPLSFDDSATAKIKFKYELPSRMGVVYTEDNTGLDCISRNEINMYQKYLADNSSVDIRESSCFKLFGESGVEKCANERRNNKIGKCYNNNYSCTLDDKCNSLSDAENLGRDWNSKSGECCQIGYKYNNESGKCEPSGKCQVKNGKYYIGNIEVSGTDYNKYCDLDGDYFCPDENLGLCPDGTCGRYINGILVCSNSITGNLFDSVIYRVVGLDNPFVGKAGKDRDTGNNWCGYDVTSKSFSCNSKNPNVRAIFYARNSSSQAKNVYSDSHVLYKVTLDSESIGEIRDYNKKNSYDDWNLKCMSDDDNVCFSNFLKETSYFKDNKLEGECALNKNSNTFYTCGN